MNLYASLGYCREKNIVIAQEYTAALKPQPQYYFYKQWWICVSEVSHLNQNPTSGAAWMQHTGLGLQMWEQSEKLWARKG